MKKKSIVKIVVSIIIVNILMVGIQLSTVKAVSNPAISCDKTENFENITEKRDITPRTYWQTDPNEPNDHFYNATQRFDNHKIEDKQFWYNGKIEGGTGYPYDKDYYRFDILADAEVEITLRNLPADYDLLLYKHSDIPNSTYDSTERIDKSINDEINNENIIRFLTPGTYYVEVSAKNYEVYDNENFYELIISIHFPNRNGVSIRDLKYNKGAKAAVWISDIAPLGIKNYRLYGREYVGYRTDGVISSSYYFENPYYDELRRLSDYGEVTQYIIYLWDKDYKDAIRDYLAQIIGILTKTEYKSEKIRMKIDPRIDDLGNISFCLSVASIIPTPISIYSGALATKLAVIQKEAQYIFHLLFPYAWEARPEYIIRHLIYLYASLESSSSSDEVIMLKSAFHIDEEFDKNRVNYYIDYTPVTEMIFNQEGGPSSIFEDDIIPAQVDNCYSQGKIYGLRGVSDFQKLVDGELLSSSLPNVNTSKLEEVHLNTPDEEWPHKGLEVGEYHWYKFTAPDYGVYRFEVISHDAMFLEAFHNIVGGQSIEGRINYSNTKFEGSIFKVWISTRPGDTIYIRVHGDDYNLVGRYTMMVFQGENEELTLRADPENKPCGTEVSLRGGARNETTMVVGFTRLLYPGNDAPSNSRLDYYWLISDETLATISSYGTLYAKCEGIVTVTAISKLNYQKRCLIEITILPDPGTKKTFIPVTTDKKEDPTLNGTEVTTFNQQAGLFSVHIGYTRAICFLPDYMFPSLLDFNWSSSNPIVARVSDYGYVTGIWCYGLSTPQQVTITGCSKYNPNLVIRVTFTVFPN